MTRFGKLFTTMAARVFAVLFIGVILAAVLALGFANNRRQAEVDAGNETQLVGVVASYVAAVSAAAPQPRLQLLENGVQQLRPLQRPPRRIEEAPSLKRAMMDRLGSRLVDLKKTDLDVCYFATGLPGAASPLGCWIIELAFEDHSRVRLALSLRGSNAAWSSLDLNYLAILTAAAAALSLLVARMITAPLAALSRAVAAIGPGIDGPPIPVRGPVEVQNAALALNSMQDRLRQSLAERAHMLASITHDLQTPLTRMRLKLARVTDEGIRERLASDVSAMEALVQEGLELADSVELVEPLSVLDLDSLLKSLVEDAQDAGQEVTFVQGCSVDVETRPQCLRRCVTNLIDNAVKFAGAAEVSSILRPDGAQVIVRDRGRGIPQDELETVLQPFVRLERSRSRATGGVGLGLTIAQVLAKKNGAVLNLSNHPGGGLVASVDGLPVVARAWAP